MPNSINNLHIQWEKMTKYNENRQLKNQIEIEKIAININNKALTTQGYLNYLNAIQCFQTFQQLSYLQREKELIVLDIIKQIKNEHLNINIAANHKNYYATLSYPTNFIKNIIQPNLYHLNQILPINEQIQINIKEIQKNIPTIPLKNIYKNIHNSSIQMVDLNTLVKILTIKFDIEKDVQTIIKDTDGFQQYLKRTKKYYHNNQNMYQWVLLITGFMRFIKNIQRKIIKHYQKTYVTYPDNNWSYRLYELNLINQHQLNQLITLNNKHPQLPQ